MKVLSSISRLFNKLLGKKEKPKVIILDNNPLSISSYMEEHPEFDRFIPPSKKVDRVPLSEIRAVRKMKHGHQAPWYRKSVKANVKPEEDD